jgi:hypothetical protein
VEYFVRGEPTETGGDGMSEQKPEQKLSVETELALLRQSIQDAVLPLLRKHDNCLYGEKGDDGIVRDINYLRGLVYVVVVLIGSGALTAGIYYLRLFLKGVQL